MKERPLLVFTLLSQLSVGTFLSLVSGQFGLDVSMQAHQQNLTLPLILCGILIGSGLLVLLLHLGSPRQALHALNNLSDSWLSREIFFGLLYAICGGFFTATIWLPGVSQGFIFFLATMAAACGMAFLYSMGRLYMLRTVPVWNTQLTPLTFFLSALSLGYLANSLILSLSNSPALHQLSAITGQAAILWITLQIITTALFTVRIRRILGLRFSSYLPHAEQLNNLLVVRMVTIVLASLSSGLFLIDPNQILPLQQIAAATFLIDLLSEFVSRVIFYGIYHRSGI